MSRVTLTINLELSIPGLPSQEALNAAMQRAESAAARVFLNGDLGASPNAVPMTCGTVDVLSGRINATVGRRKKS